LSLASNDLIDIGLDFREKIAERFSVGSVREEFEKLFTLL